MINKPKTNTTILCEKGMGWTWIPQAGAWKRPSGDFVTKPNFLKDKRLCLELISIFLRDYNDAEIYFGRCGINREVYWVKIISPTTEMSVIEGFGSNLMKAVVSVFTLYFKGNK